MSVPKKRRTNSKGRRGRSHEALAKGSFVKCAKCGKPTMPHRACPSCGYYRGREVVKLKTKKKKPAASK